MHDFAAGGALGGFIARLVALEFFIDDARAGNALVGAEAERAGTDHFGERLGGIGFGEARRHDAAHAGRIMAERIGQQGEGFLEAEADGFVVGSGDFVGAGHQRLAEAVALAPAGDGGGGILGEHLGAVMEHQPVAQGKVPGLAVVFDGMAFDHLRADAVFVVLAIERVEHHEAVVAGLVGCGDDGIGDGEVGIRHEAERLGGLCIANAGRCQGDSGGGEEGAAAHDVCSCWKIGQRKTAFANGWR